MSPKVWCEMLLHAGCLKKSGTCKKPSQNRHEMTRIGGVPKDAKGCLLGTRLAKRAL